MTAIPPPWTRLTGTAHAIALEVLLRGPLPRSELARRLGLSAASVTRLAKPLLDSGLLIEEGPSQQSRTGRPTRPLDIAPSSHHFIGVKVTGEDAHAVLTTLRAEVIASCRSDLRGKDPEAVVATVAGLVAELASGAPHVTALGLSLGGQVPDHRTVVAAPFLEWTEDIALGALLEEATGLPTVVENDLLALTRAEHWFGAARDHDRFAVLTTGVSVGYGLVVHGAVVDSPDAGVGLVGHFPLDPLGPMCPEGHRGCASAMLSMPSVCASVSVGLQRPVTYEECLDLAAEGHPVAEPVITASARALGRLVAAVANLTMTPLVILTGEGIRLAEVARPALDEALRRDRNPRAAPLSLEVQAVDFAQWARGAAATAVQDYVLSGAAEEGTAAD
ncbi:ROK family transcriptional regulator [Streptomyces sp. NPDC051776]|uniref:ROK family transcriptional regulator n=1 Tax=Streptomyces sp. NPDC051776 TaxID=3155414 RepID=UPI00343879B0